MSEIDRQKSKLLGAELQAFLKKLHIDETHETNAAGRRKSIKKRSSLYSKSPEPKPADRSPFFCFDPPVKIRPKSAPITRIVSPSNATKKSRKGSSPRTAMKSVKRKLTLIKVPKLFTTPPKGQSTAAQGGPRKMSMSSRKRARDTKVAQQNKPRRKKDKKKARNRMLEFEMWDGKKLHPLVDSFISRRAQKPKVRRGSNKEIKIIKMSLEEKKKCIKGSTIEAFIQAQMRLFWKAQVRPGHLVINDQFLKDEDLKIFLNLLQNEKYIKKQLWGVTFSAIDLREPKCLAEIKNFLKNLNIAAIHFMFCRFPEDVPLNFLSGIKSITLDSMPRCEIFRIGCLEAKTTYLGLDYMDLCWDDMKEIKACMRTFTQLQSISLKNNRLKMRDMCEIMLYKKNSKLKRIDVSGNPIDLMNDKDDRAYFRMLFSWLADSRVTELIFKDTEIGK